MKTLILKDIVEDSSSNKQGTILFNYLNSAFVNGESLVLEVGSDLSMSSSFLNTSIGCFLDNYGMKSFKETVKFKGSKNQFSRLSHYLKTYSEIYLA